MMDVIHINSNVTVLIERSTFIENHAENAPAIFAKGKCCNYNIE